MKTLFLRSPSIVCLIVLLIRPSLALGHTAICYQLGTNENVYCCVINQNINCDKLVPGPGVTVVDCFNFLRVSPPPDTNLVLLPYEELQPTPGTVAFSLSSEESAPPIVFASLNVTIDEANISATIMQTNNGAIITYTNPLLFAGGPIRMLHFSFQNTASNTYGLTIPLIPIPTLGITLSNQTAVLSWPDAAPGFTLQQNADASTTNWSDVVSSGTNLTIIPITNMGGYFRLTYH